MIEVVSPFPFHALPKLWRWTESVRSRIADDFFPETLDAFVEYWERLELGGRRSWGFALEGVLRGAAVSARTGAICCDIHCVFERKHWPQDRTRQAMRLVVDELFSDTPNNRIEKISTMAFADNNSLTAIVRSFGGTREGLLRNHARRGGKLVDVMMLGLERERYYVLRDQSQFVVDGLVDAATDKPVVQPGHNGKLGGHDQHQRRDVGHNGQGALARTAEGARLNIPGDSGAHQKPAGILSAGAESGA